MSRSVFYRYPLCKSILRFAEHSSLFIKGLLGCEGVVVSFRWRSLLVGLSLTVLLGASTVCHSYMPPPDPCEMVPMTYGPPAPPTCAGPPTIPPCTPCPPVRCYPRKLVGPPPCSMTICKCPPEPTPASYRVCPQPACPPPPACAPAPCAPGPLGFAR